MKDWMNKYIEFLLTTHNCLVIPGLGGFIVSGKSDLIHSELKLLPQFTVAFNQDLNHNDGILYASLQKYEGMSYDKACQKVQKEVAAIKAELRSFSSYSIGRIGSLKLNSENNIEFEPNKDYIHPTIFGLQPVRLQKLELEETNVIPLIVERKINKLSYAVCAAIALILFFVAPVMNNQDKHYVQQAGMVNVNSNTSSEIVELVNDAVTSEDVSEEIMVDTDAEAKDILPQVQVVNAPLRTYYIIIGSETSPQRRDLLMTKFGKDFEQLSFVETDGRYRIYAASFDDKTEAESFLINFRAENPKYETAWLYSKKN